MNYENSLVSQNIVYVQYVNLVFKLSNHYIKTTLIEKTSCEESSIGKAIDVDVVLKGDLTIISPMTTSNLVILSQFP